MHDVALIETLNEVYKWKDSIYGTLEMCSHLTS